MITEEVGQWEIVDTGSKPASDNMAYDAELLATPRKRSLLHLYAWSRPSLTYGYFIRPDDHLFSSTQLDMARRPTGGGIVFHTADLAFSALVPTDSSDTMEGYRYMHDIVLAAVKRCLSLSADLLPEEPTPRTEASRHFCYAKPTRYDVMLGGKKVAGAAQRRVRGAFLHQGSISIAVPRELDLLRDAETATLIEETTYSMLGATWKPAELEEVRQALRAALIAEVLHG